ncbi:hypothetical protein CNECB9_740010 [Cupriavidus necator]|uniref:Uncharacterized protein n=1 Tax=Cupriavidus necator TaxID=106590 RepID=A0A1K0JZC7_CUPNE|nr:hypothetical protein CNECB9_740010 [Cupriavidus necator]
MASTIPGAVEGGRQEMIDSPRLPQLSETAIVQNAAIGAFALWNFGLAFQERDGLPAPMGVVA